MKKIYIMMIALAAALVLGAGCTKETEEVPQTMEEHTLMTKIVGETGGEFEQGSLLVKVDGELAAELAQGAELFIDGEKITIGPALGFRPKNMEIARKYGLDRWFSISFDESRPVREMATKIAMNPSVVSVQYNSYLEPVTSDVVMPFIPAPFTRSAEEAAGLPFDDEYLGKQWNLINTGDETVAKGAVEGADVGVKDAWRLTGGDPSVVVAVFDCAVNSIHEDLREALWINQEEVDGEAGKDDDDNGFVDDKYGFNFVGCKFTDGRPTTGNALNWSKGSGHGTHVAGIIGATNGNGKGVSSIAGGTGQGDGVRLMTCQIFNGNSSASDRQNAAAFIYAADNGACIAQCSYGSSSIITDDDSYINGNEDEDINGSPLENAALLYFLDPANSNHESLKGNIAVFAAGNHSNPYSSYPGALPYVLSVTAFGADYLPGGYTNYGPGCKIAAPGGEYTDSNNYGTMILSTGVSNAAQSSPGVTGSDGRSDNNYVYMQGTSMACPHVSGVIALGISYAKKLGKTFDREDFTSLLLTSVNDIDKFCIGTKDYYSISSYNWETINLERYDGKLGTGAVDAWKFLMAIEGTPSVMVKTGDKALIDLDDYFGEGVVSRIPCKVSVDAATRNSLGLVSDPIISKGRLEINCSSVGSGKITISAAVGKDPEGSIGEMAFSREISIVSRPYAASNGGWF